MFSSVVLFIYIRNKEGIGLKLEKRNDKSYFWKFKFEISVRQTHGNRIRLNIDVELKRCDMGR